jgi:nitronate monooxygenase
MPLRTRLTERFNLTHPILGAPMGSVGGGKLAAAVSQAGGLGLIGGGYGVAEWLEHEFAEAGNARVGCGFITWSLANTPTLLDSVLARAPAALMLSFGDVSPFAGKIKQAGIPLICQVQTMTHAREAVAAGADVIVAQGSEAGGHGASRATLTLVPEVSDYLAKAAPETLLVAAGGIADGRGLAAALMLGADGVLIGSRLVASREGLTHPRVRDAVVAADGDSTVRTTVVDVVRSYEWPKPFTGRTLNTKFVSQWHGSEAALAEPATVARESARYWEAVREGDADNIGIFMGEAAGLIHGVEPAGDLVERMAKEAERLVGEASRFVVS